MAYAGFAARHSLAAPSTPPGPPHRRRHLRHPLRPRRALRAGAHGACRCPAYDPQHGLAEITGRERVDLLGRPTPSAPTLDLDRARRPSSREGARTLLLTQPHNPAGRVYTRAELQGVRDVVPRHGARVISDEIHGALALPGAEHALPHRSRAPPTTPSRWSPRPRRSTSRGSVRPDRGRPTPRRAAAPRPRWPSNDAEGPWAWSPRWRPTTRGRRLAGLPGRAARRASPRCSGALLAEHLPPRPDAAPGGHLPGLAGPARPTATTTRWCLRRGTGAGRLAPGNAIGPGLPGHAGSTSPRRPSGSTPDRGADGRGAGLRGPAGAGAFSACAPNAPAASHVLRLGLGGDQVGVPLERLLGRALQGVVVDVHEAERWVKPSAHSKLSISDHV